MAKIPEFQQQQLESSLVSNPSLDTSGKRIADSVSDLGETGMRVFGQKMIERQQAIETVEANKQATDYEVELEKTYQEHQRNNATDPTGKTDAFKAVAEQMLAERVKNTKGSAAQQSVAVIGQRMLGNKLVQERKWAMEQQSHNAVIDVGTTLNKRAESAYQFGLDGDVQQALSEFSKHTTILAGSKAAISADSYAKLEKAAPETLAKAAINGMLASHPEKVNEFLKSLPAGTLEPEQTSKYKEEAKAAILNIQKTREFEYLANTVAQENPDLYQRYINGDATLLGDLETHPNKKTASVLREIILKQNPADAEVKAERTMELYTQFADLGVAKRKGQIVSVAADLEEVLAFQSSVLKAVRNGEISAQTGSKFMRDLSAPLAKKIAAKAGKSFGEAIGFSQPDNMQVGVRAINAWVDKRKDTSNPAGTKVEMLQKFVERVAKEQPKNREEVSKIINDIQVEQAHFDHPEIAGMVVPPAAHYGSTGVISPVAAGSKAPTSAKVKAPYTRKWSPTTKKYYRVYADGKKELDPNQNA